MKRQYLEYAILHAVLSTLERAWTDQRKAEMIISYRKKKKMYENGKVVVLKHERFINLYNKIWD